MRILDGEGPDSAPLGGSILIEPDALTGHMVRPAVDQAPHGGDYSTPVAFFLHQAESREMGPDPETHDVLDGFKVIQHVCDLDLLMFLHRHPRALLALDQLAAYIGCDRERVAKSLENLIADGLVVRRQKPPSAVPIFLLASNGGQGQRLETLLAIASTRHGRLRIRQALASARPSEDHVHSPGEPPVKGNHA